MLSKIKPLFPYLRRYWIHFAWGGVAVILYNTIRAALPLLIGHAVDDLKTGLTEQKIVFHSVRLLVVAAFSAIFLYVTRQVLIGASREIEFDLRNDLFANLERQSAAFYNTHRTGDIMARTTNDLSAVRQLLGPAIMYSANTIVFTAAALPVMYHLNARLTLIAFVPLPIASVLVQQFGARIHRRFERHPGHVLGHLRQGPGKLFPARVSSARSPRKRPKSPPSRPRTSNTSRAPSISSASWPCFGPRSSSSSPSRWSSRCSSAATRSSPTPSPSASSPSSWSTWSSSPGP